MCFVCLSLCVCVVKDLTNYWTNMILLCSEDSGKVKGCFTTILERVPSVFTLQRKITPKKRHAPSETKFESRVSTYPFLPFL